MRNREIASKLLALGHSPDDLHGAADDLVRLNVGTPLSSDAVCGLRKSAELREIAEEMANLLALQTPLY